MADVFISYSKQTPEPTRKLAAQLEARGYSVWWDPNLFTGEDFTDAIMQRLQEAKAVIVIWSPASVKSHFVRDEAGFARDAGKLVPLHTADLALSDVPLGFRSFHTSPVENIEEVVRSLARLGLAQGQPKRDPAAEGRIKVGAPSTHGANDGWFLPGNGKNEWFKDLEKGPEMVVIPAGIFMFGEGVDAKEKTIKSPFAVSRFPITFDDWDAAYADRGVKHYPDDNGWGRGRRPVIDVSWYDANEYVAWLMETANAFYSLLPEVLWVYACRANTTTTYHFGDNITKKLAHYDARTTLEVGFFPPNDWGLYDMHGNVWEWCLEPDSFHLSPMVRKQRGGSWSSEQDKLARTHIDIANFRSSDVGFRVTRHV